MWSSLSIILPKPCFLLFTESQRCIAGDQKIFIQNNKALYSPVITDNRQSRRSETYGNLALIHEALLTRGLNLNTLYYETKKYQRNCAITWQSSISTLRFHPALRYLSKNLDPEAELSSGAENLKVRLYFSVTYAWIFNETHLMNALFAYYIDTCQYLHVDRKQKYFCH